MQNGFDSLVLDSFTAEDAWELGHLLYARLLPFAAQKPTLVSISLANSGQVLFQVSIQLIFLLITLLYYSTIHTHTHTHTPDTFEFPKRFILHIADLPPWEWGGKKKDGSGIGNSTRQRSVGAAEAEHGAPVRHEHVVHALQVRGRRGGVPAQVRDEP